MTQAISPACGRNESAVAGVAGAWRRITGEREKGSYIVPDIDVEFERIGALGLGAIVGELDDVVERVGIDVLGAGHG